MGFYMRWCPIFCTDSDVKSRHASGKVAMKTWQTTGSKRCESFGMKILTKIRFYQKGLGQATQPLLANHMFS